MARRDHTIATVPAVAILLVALFAIRTKEL